jgi:hypothetical protein
MVCRLHATKVQDHSPKHQAPETEGQATQAHRQDRLYIYQK